MNDDGVDALREAMRELANTTVPAPLLSCVQSEDQRALGDVQREAQELANYLRNLEGALEPLLKSGRTCVDLLDELEASAREMVHLHVRARALRVAIALAEPRATSGQSVPIIREYLDTRTMTVGRTPK